MILVMLAILLLVFLAAGGLAVDAANLYHVKLQSQRAADAGALAGATILAKSEGNRDAALQMARVLASANARRAGIDRAPEEISASIPSPGQVRVDIATDASLYILPMVPGYGSSRNVATSAVAAAESRPRYLVSMVVDTSGSMRQLASADCTLRRRQCPSKFDELKRATKEFVQSFDEKLDRIALITFESKVDEAARLPRNVDVLQWMDQEWSKAVLVPKIDNPKHFNVGGFTNIADGIAHGQKQLTLPTIPKEFDAATKIFVLITDGSPTRELTDETRRGKLWCRLEADVPVGEDTDGDGVPDDLSGDGIVDILPPYTDGDRRRPFDDREYLDGCTDPFGDQITDGRRCFIRTIQAADALREAVSGVNFYSIGLGIDSRATDAYQNWKDPKFLKPFLMRRLSNDVANGAIDPAFDCVPNYEKYNQTKRPQGEYMSTEDATELTELLKKIRPKGSRARLVL
jgi:Flp pilus assembly protein TadG